MHQHPVLEAALHVVLGIALGLALASLVLAMLLDGRGKRRMRGPASEPPRFGPVAIDYPVDDGETFRPLGHFVNGVVVDLDRRRS